MTATQGTTKRHGGISGTDEAPVVAWEPCAAYADTGTPAPGCGVCGWLADDHEVEDGAEHLGGDAIVVTLPARTPLRRAS